MFYRVLPYKNIILLKFLENNSCLKELDLSFNKINNQYIQKIRKLSELKYINLFFPFLFKKNENKTLFKYNFNIYYKINGI